MTTKTGLLLITTDVDLPMVEVNIMGATAGEYLCFDGTVWVNETVDVTNLGDVTINNLIPGECLCYDGTNWTNTFVTSGSGASGAQFLNDLLDVNVPMPNDGECLCFTGGVWVATPIIAQADISGPPFQVVAMNDAGTEAVTLQDQVIIASEAATVVSGARVTSISSGTITVEGTENSVIAAENSRILDGITSTTGLNGDGDVIMVTGAGVAENSVILGGRNLKNIHRNATVTGEEYQSHEDNSFNIGGKLFIKDLEPLNVGTGATGIALINVQVLDDLGDVEVPTPMDGEYLCFTGGVWISSSISTQANISGPAFEVVAMNDAGTEAVTLQDQTIMSSSGSTVDINGSRISVIATENSRILDGVTSTTGLNGDGDVIMVTGAGIAENSVILGGRNLKNIHRNAVVTGEEYQSHEDNSLNVGGKLFIKDVNEVDLGTGATGPVPFFPQWFTATVSTTNNTNTTIASITIQSNASYTIVAHFAANQTNAAGVSGGYRLLINAYNDGAVQVRTSKIQLDGGGSSGWNVFANGTATELILQVSGDTNDDVDWRVAYYIVQI